MVADRLPHEPDPIGSGTRREKHAVADDAVAQQGRGSVQDHQIDPLARDVAGQHGHQVPDGILQSRGSRGPGVVDQHRNVDVAVGALGPASPAAKEPGGTHHRMVAQPVGEHAAERRCQRSGLVSVRQGHADPQM